MATWHQQRSGRRLYHDTQWTIVTDPPGDLRTLWLEPTKEAAKDRLAVWKANGRNIQHCYILRPARTAANKPSSVPLGAWLDDVAAETPLIYHEGNGK